MEIRSNGFDPNRASMDFTRPNRETIDENTPKPRSAEDVRERTISQRQLAAERAAAARQAQLAERAQNARETLKAQRIDNARRLAAASPSDSSRPAAGEQVDSNAAAQSERAAHARAEMLAERAQNAREILAEQRIDNARDKVSLSETSLRLRARSSERAQNASDNKASRLDEIRDLHRQGRVNTDELIAKAAFKMLSGE